jgi:hypothetical protein
MRLLLFTFIFFITTSLLAQEFRISGGFDLSGTHEITPTDPDYGISSETDNTTGTSLSAEALYNINKRFAVGIGASFGIKRKLKNWQGSFTTIPIYALAQYRLSEADAFPYIGARAGKASLKVDEDYIGDGTSDGGFYWALVGGYTYKFFFIEGLYQSQSGSAFNNGGFDFDIVFSRLTVNAGIRVHL